MIEQSKHQDEAKVTYKEWFVGRWVLINSGLLCIIGGTVGALRGFSEDDWLRGCAIVGFFIFGIAQLWHGVSTLRSGYRGDKWRAASRRKPG